MRVFVLGSCVLALTAIAAAPTPIELNRAGRWSEAAELATESISDESLPVGARCEAYVQLAYAEVRLGRIQAAAEHLDQLDATCSATISGTWVEAEVARLRTELTGRRTGDAADDDWELASDPSAPGLDTAALSEHLALCEASAADACLVVVGDRIVQDYRGPHYGVPMMAMSATKSITGLIAGMLIGDGKLSLDAPVCRWIPEWRAGADDGVTVRQLLAMTSGLAGSHDPRPPSSHVGGVNDKEALVFGLPLTARPGQAWAYSNEGAFLLSPLLDRAAGEPVEEYAAHRLFAPLGMGSTRFHVYPAGQAWTHADLETTPRDLARIGQLMIRHGRWNGTQIVPRKWVDASVRPSQSLNPRYGMLWWLDVPGGFAARGYLDTNLYVFPDRDLVVVRMQSKPRPGAARYEPRALTLFRKLTTRGPEEAD